MNAIPGPYLVEHVPIDSIGGSNTAWIIGPMQAIIYDDWRQTERGFSSDQIKQTSELMALAPEMWDLIEQFGRAVTNMFEQLERGDWKDSEGHCVRLNARMIDLKKPVLDAIELRRKAKASAL